MAQIQGCMWMSGRAWWDFVSFNPDFPDHLQLKIVRVKRDDAFIEKIEKEIINADAEVQEKISAINRIAA